MDRLSLMDVDRFQSVILGYYRKHPRSFPWRQTRDPYAILVSEIMLQQTQTARVLPKYQEFMDAFPTVHDLAAADLSRVLRIWQGLGYNRRAKFLKACAEHVCSALNGGFPETREELRDLPGIGTYTSGAVCAFAFGQPVAFIETNIRRVFLHFYFPDSASVRDTEILRLVESTLFTPDPRSWYYALMDYGAMLGRAFPNANRRSAHYTRQSKFEGSSRQIRGRILRVLGHGPTSYAKLIGQIEFEEKRVTDALDALQSEGMVVWEESQVYLPGDERPG